MATPEEIRANYYRSMRRSPQAQAIAQRLEEAPRKNIEESRRISDWNTGRDPTLRAIRGAEVALAPGGFSSVGMDATARRGAVTAGVEAEVPEWLPSDMRGRLQQRQDQMGQRLVGREKEQAEFSQMAGVAAPNMGGEAPVSPETRRQRGMTAESYWMENQGPMGPMTAEQAAGEDRLARIQELEAIRYDPESEYNINRREKEKAEGQRASDLFASWEAEKQFATEGREIQRDARRRLTDVNRKLRSGDLTAQEYNELFDEKRQLQGITSLQDIGSDKQVTGLGRQAEAGRKKREEESNRLRQAMLTRAETAETEAAGARKARAEVSPYLSSIYDLFGSAMNYNFGLGR
jgi:hypothetical protein